MRTLSAENIEIRKEQYLAFIESNQELSMGSPDISLLTPDNLRQAVSWAAIFFQDEIEQVVKNLNDPVKAIVSLDIAEDEGRSAESDAYWGVALASALTTNVFPPAEDRFNEMPFTVYAAEPAKSQALARLGVVSLAPETRLGFHTDGVISGDTIALPRHIMLYNMMIGYKEPGNFYWVPFALWRDKAVFMECIGVGRKYALKVTPSVYEDDDGAMQLVTPRCIKVPIFLDNAREDFPLYLNGEVQRSVGEISNQVELVGALRESIQSNFLRFAIAQRPRRLIFACNTKGAHARDVFEGPLGDGGPYTRIFIRAVDANCVAVNG